MAKWTPNHSLPALTDIRYIRWRSIHIWCGENYWVWRTRSLISANDVLFCRSGLTRATGTAPNNLVSCTVWHLGLPGRHNNCVDNWKEADSAKLTTTRREKDDSKGRTDNSRIVCRMYLVKQPFWSGRSSVWISDLPADMLWLKHFAWLEANWRREHQSSSNLSLSW